MISYSAFCKTTKLRRSKRLLTILEKENLIADIKKNKYIKIKKEAISLADKLANKYILDYRKEEKKYLYIIEYKNYIKIGYSTKPQDRFLKLKKKYKEQLNSDLNLLWISNISKYEYSKIENSLHKLLHFTEYTAKPPKKIDGMDEWYKKDVLPFLKEYLKLIDEDILL